LPKLLYNFAPQAFCSINSFAHATFTCIEPTFSYLHKEFLILHCPAQSSTRARPAPVCITLRIPAPVPQPAPRRTLVDTNPLADVLPKKLLCSKKILTKLVGYQQSTCLCVKMEIVVGNISLSCELYSFLWSCFCPCGVGTIVYGKWCFVSHMQYCGSCTVGT